MTAETDSPQGSPWLFLLGALGVLGSAGLVAYDLFTGGPVLRGVLANSVAVALVLALVGRAVLADPDSSIQTRLEAGRATLSFYGGYLLVAGVVVLVVGPERVAVGYLLVAGGLLLVTFLTGGDRVVDRVSTLVGLAGLVLAVGSVPVFAYDLVTGGDVLRGIAANGVGMALFVLWSVRDMPADPDIGVETVTDGLGMAVLLYGGYLVAAGAVVAVTGLAGHTRGGLGLLYLALGVVTLVVGGLVAPLEQITADPRPRTNRPSAVGDDLDIHIGNADAGKLCADVLAGGIERTLATVEPAGDRRLEGDTYLPAVDLLAVAAALDLVELVAHPDVRRVAVRRPPVARRLLALLVEGSRERGIAAPATNE